MEYLQPLISMWPDNKNIVDVPAPHLSRAHVKTGDRGEPIGHTIAI